MLRAIDNSMAYHLTNPSRALGKGLSCFFPYNGYERAFDLFAEISGSPAWKHFYDFIRNGRLSAEGQAYLTSLTSTPSSTPPETLPAPSTLGLDGIGLSPHGNGVYWLELGDKAANVAAVHLMVGQYVAGMADFVLFGTRTSIYADWEYGLFYDEFDVKWGSIDGTLCQMEVVSQGSGFTLYRVPVTHNGESKFLMVTYRWIEPYAHEGKYEILGLLTHTAFESHGPEVVYEELKVGDVIDPVMLFFNQEQVRNSNYSMPGSTSGGRSIVVTKNTSFYDVDLGDGLYMIAFVMIDYSGVKHYSKNGFYSIKDGIFSFATY
jgi:hypothetical protein